MRVLVVGVGSPIRGDDAIGPAVAAEVCTLRGEGYDYLPFAGSGLDLLGHLQSYDRVVLVDSIVDPAVAEGECCRLVIPESHEKSTPASLSSHHVGLFDGLRVASRLGLSRPRDVRLYGIGVRAVEEYADGPSTQLVRHVHRLAKEICSDLDVEEGWV